MPRPNKPRSVLDEDNLARRVTFEREARGWSYEGLAQRMTDWGCPIQASALFKIEKGSPRRRIVYAEAVTLARVFGIPLEHLSLPPEAARIEEAERLLAEFRQAQDDVVAARRTYNERAEALYELLKDHPELDQWFLDHAQWSEVRGDPQVAALDQLVAGIGKPATASGVKRRSSTRGGKSK